MKKRTIALLLAGALVVSLLGGAALAVEEKNSESPILQTEEMEEPEGESISAGEPKSQTEESVPETEEDTAVSANSTAT